jgi:flagellum-specific peptidoglycan hydrolase FlgJ
MFNVQNLTNTLSRMELPDLQKYAAMHKNDPYVVSLALSIANQKKQMMVGKAGQAGMQPQPNVVDQQIAGMAPPPQQQMLPEDTGIGQLPAQNMQNMAEGGIVAFEDGGQVPGYAAGGQPDPKQAFAIKYRDAALAAGQALGVDPGILISQWGIETRWGQSKKPVQANNLGNIKAGSTWKGPTVTQHDKAEKSIDKYRSYDSTDAFVKDYVNLIKTRYPESVGAGSDVNKFAKGLRSGEQGGYATDKNYASTLVSTAKNLSPLVPVSTAQAAQAAPAAQTTSSAPASNAPLTRLSDASIPADYKKEQALQQAARDAQTKKLQSEGFLDKTSRVGQGVVGNLEAGANALTGMVGYPLGYLGAIATDPTGAAAAIQNKPEGTGFYNRMRDIQDAVTYQPRTDVGELQAEGLSTALSFLPPFLPGPDSAKPSKRIALKPPKPTTTTKPGLLGIAESQTTAAPKVGEQLSLFPESKTAPAGLPAVLPEVSPAALQAIQAKQAAARAALQKDGASGLPKFEVTPENAGIASVQRNMIAKNKAAEAAARAEAARIAEAARAAEMPAKPAVSVVPAQEAVKTAESAITPETVVTPEQTPAKPAQVVTTLTEADMLERAKAFELDQEKADIIRRNQDKVKAVLPGITNPVPVTGVEDNTSLDNGMNYGYEQAPMPELPKEDEQAVIAKLKEATGATTGELKQQAADNGMDFNSFLIRFGLGLMAGESPYAAVNVGKAGLGALDAQLAEQKSRQAQAASLSDSELKKMQAKYYGSYAEAIERGAKEKDSQLQAETLVQQRMEKWLSGPGKMAEALTPGATAKEEERVRRAIYQQLGLNPIMAAGAPAGQKLSYNPETGKIG